MESTSTNKVITTETNNVDGQQIETVIVNYQPTKVDLTPQFEDYVGSLVNQTPTTPTTTTIAAKIRASVFEAINSMSVVYVAMPTTDFKVGNIDTNMGYTGSIKTLEAGKYNITAWAKATPNAAGYVEFNIISVARGILCQQIYAAPSGGASFTMLATALVDLPATDNIRLQIYNGTSSSLYLDSTYFVNMSAFKI